VKKICECSLILSGLGTIEGPCKRGNELTGCIGDEFVEWRSDCYFLKKDSVTLSSHFVTLHYILSWRLKLVIEDLNVLYSQ
jgi:hypothetical protein